MPLLPCNDRHHCRQAGNTNTSHQVHVNSVTAMMYTAHGETVLKTNRDPSQRPTDNTRPGTERLPPGMIILYCKYYY